MFINKLSRPDNYHDKLEFNFRLSRINKIHMMNFSRYNYFVSGQGQGQGNSQGQGQGQGYMKLNDNLA